MTVAKHLAVNVKIDGDYLDRLHEVVGMLQNEGFVLSESLEAIGVLVGSVPAASLKRLSAVEGVLAVEKSRSDYHTQES